jgi:hypothetical protein
MDSRIPHSTFLIAKGLFTSKYRWALYKTVSAFLKVVFQTPMATRISRWRPWRSARSHSTCQGMPLGFCPGCWQANSSACATWFTNPRARGLVGFHHIDRGQRLNGLACVSCGGRWVPP